jgi:transmembrane sensor
MKNINSKVLFDKYTAGHCSEEEKAIVEGWFLNELKTEKFRPTDSKIKQAKESSWKVISPKRNTLPFLKWSSYAAAIILIAFFIYEVNIGKENQTVATKNILLASKVENMMMKLPDSSIVILEKGSKLTLLPSFNKSIREVILVGKAFFDIKHNADKPFVIHAGELKTTVLGTSFDIDARPNANEVKINVIRGKVKVENENSLQLGILVKDMQIVYNYKSSASIINHVDAEKELLWNKQDLEFNDISLGDAKTRLEDQFGFKIIVTDPELAKQTFHYSMRAKESVESFVKSICVFIDAGYTIDYKNKIISIQHLNQ